MAPIDTYFFRAHMHGYVCIAAVMNREQAAAAAAAVQMTEQLAVQQLAAKQALKQVSPLSCKMNSRCKDA